MNEGPELLEDEEESEDLSVEGLSFFSGASALDLPLNDPAWDVFERADRAVTDRIWRIYQRQSGEGRLPLAALPMKEVPATVLVPCPTAPPATTTTDKDTEGETMTAQPKKRGEMLEQTLAAYKKVEARIGAKPSALEVYAELGEAGKSVENVRMAVKRLAQKGLVEQVRPQPTTKTIVKVTPTPQRANRKPIVAKEPTVKTFRRDAQFVGVASKSDFLNDSTTDKRFWPSPAPPVRVEPASDDPVLAALIAKRDAHADKVAALTAAIEAWQS